MRVSRTGVVEVALHPDQALPLFTARGETLWVPGWSPVYIEPLDGEPVAGGIWLTEDRFPDGRRVEVIWRVERYDPDARIAQYLRVVPGHRVVVVTVECAPWLQGGAVHTRATVTYAVTALSDEGQQWLAAWDQAAFDGMLKEWARLLARYLERD